MENCEAMTSSTHSFAYSYGLVKKCFLKICEISKFHNFLIFQPIFIRFSLFCSENFTLSSENKLDQLRTSPLTAYGTFKLHLMQGTTQRGWKGEKGSMSNSTTYQAIYRFTVPPKITIGLSASIIAFKIVNQSGYALGL